MDKNEEWKKIVLKRIAGLRYIDDRFMRACLKGDKTAVKLLIRVILGFKVKKLTSLIVQDNLSNLHGRSVTIDVHAVDSTGREVAIEIQRSNTGAGIKRARYIGSLMDAQLLPEGQDPDTLPDNYVIFITEHDIYKSGQALYKIDSYIDIDDELTPANDGRHIVYVNCEYKGDDEIGRLIHDLLCTDPDKMYFEELAKRARYFKKTEEGIRKMSNAFEEFWREGLLEGFQEGATERSKDIAVSFLRLGKNTVEEIAEATKLPVEYIKNLQKEVGRPKS